MLKWLLIGVLLVAVFLLWIERDRVVATVLSFRSAETETEQSAMSGEVKSLHPGPRPGEKVYTEEDIRRLNEQQDLPARHPATYTNYDLKKYHRRAPTEDAEKIRNELKWASEPEPKRSPHPQKPLSR